MLHTFQVWEKRLAALKETLLLYALVHELMQLIMEGKKLQLD